MGSDHISPVAVLAAHGDRVVCAEEPIPAVQRVVAAALGGGLMWAVPKLVATVEVPWQATLGRLLGYLLVAAAFGAALLLRGRTVSIERGSLVITHLPAPLRPGSEQRLGGHEIRDVVVRRVRVDDGGPFFKRYRYTVNAGVAGRRLALRLATLRDPDEAERVAQRIREGLAA